MQLRRDKRRLEMEKEILKHASAYFARRTSAQNRVPAGSRTPR